MLFFYSEYALLLLYMGCSFILSIFILFLSFVFANQNPYPEKVSAYECGFDPFDDARNKFDVRFYLIALLFLVFDLEACFLFPWAVSLSKLNSGGFWIIFDFFLELFFGFFYVWRVGALEWELLAEKHFGDV